MAADAALGVVEEVRWILALMSGYLCHIFTQNWMLGTGLGIAVFFLYGRSASRRHDRAWAAEDPEI